MDFFGIGPLELLLILIITLIVFGPGKLPEIARQAGRFAREIRKTSNELTRDFKTEFEKELNAVPPAQSGTAAAPGIPPAPAGTALNTAGGEKTGDNRQDQTTGAPQR